MGVERDFLLHFVVFVKLDKFTMVAIKFMGTTASPMSEDRNVKSKQSKQVRN